jgi:purine catabolism regulatory family protein/PucR-like helix-turn-helix protein/diguanylate cyclase with GGDEF domain
VEIPPRPGPLRLADLLAARELGLSLRTGRAGGPRRRVEGAHAIEIPNPSRWVPPHWVMLTTGLRLHRKPAEQRALIAELSRARVAALGYSVGINSARVPPALLAEAQRLNFPVFEVPLETAHRDIVGFVQELVLTASPQLLERALQTQAYLMGVDDEDPLARSEGPEIGLVRRLRSLAGAPVLLLGAHGRSSWPEDHPRGDLLYRELLGRPGSGPVDLLVEDVRYVALPVHAGPQVFGWLVTPAPPAADARRLLLLLQSAAHLLGLMHAAREHTPTELRAERRRLLEHALGEPGTDARQLDRRARSMGFDFEEPCHGVLYRASDQRCAAAFDAALAAGRKPFLLTAHGVELLAFVQADRGALRALLAGMPKGGAGIGRAVNSLGEAAVSLGDARFVLDRAPEEVTDFASLPLVTWLVGRIPGGELDARVQRLLGGLRDQPLLLDAVLVYLRRDLDITATAAELKLHPNSVRYRLSRAEQMLGSSLRRPETIASLYAALVSARLW